MPLLRVPSQNVLFLKLVGVHLDNFTAHDLTALFELLNGEKCIVCAGHVTEDRVYGGAIRRGRHHHFSHDHGTIELLTSLFPGIFLSDDLYSR